MYSRERYVAVVAAIEAAEDGVCVTDQNGSFRHRNAAWQRLLAAEPDRRMLEAAIADTRHATVVRSEAQRGGAEAALDVSKVMQIPGTAGERSGAPLAPSLTLQVRTPSGEYRVRGTAVSASHASRSEIMVVVWVRRCRPRHLTPDALRERYGLTPRELRVAALMAARSGNREIAEALGISSHTARRHSEAVLRKLGVHSRAQVRERLRE
jgi:DNA-binding CsgD family transcriptional regulator